MGGIVCAYIFPHPPVLVPEVGKGDEKGASETLNAVRKAAREIRDEKPTTIIVATPHGQALHEFAGISVSTALTGDFRRFGAGGVRLEFENNTELAANIISIAESEGLSCGVYGGASSGRSKAPDELDHGAAVPLYFVDKEIKGFKLVHISASSLMPEELFKFGRCISKAVKQMDERVVFIASGDLSHHLSDISPYGYNKRGPEFDDFLVNSLRQSSPEKLLEIDVDFCISAGQCGLSSFAIMLGALGDSGINSEVYSYEGPFGIGYAVARLVPSAVERNEGLLDKPAGSGKDRMKAVRNSEDPYVTLARQTLETYVRDGSVLKAPAGLPEEMIRNRAGVFVSIKKAGRLRGCIGTISPVRKNIAEEIINNAISSGTQDPRFEPVEEDELDSLVYSVDVLMEPEPISSIDELDVIRYGVIVRSGMRSGLLLPNLEGVDTPEEQVSIALQKAGIRRGDKYGMERFEVIRHK